MTPRLTIRRIDDMHCHFRLNPLLWDVLPQTATYAGRALAMPNTRPRAILTAADAAWYRDEIRWAVDNLFCNAPRPSFEPLMSIEIRDTTTPKIIEEARKVGVVAGKVYPRGVTTNSEHGLTSFDTANIGETLRAMQDLGMLLLLHGELDRPRVLVTEREHEFLPVLEWLTETFPHLKIVLEHVSTAAGVRIVRELGPNVAATITAHHLCLTLNDVIGSGVRPHHACMPMPKHFDDRDALIEAATGADRKFFLGSDSAPHPREKKECEEGACGVYTAPVLLPVLAEVFEKVGKLHRLEYFTSIYGAKFYGLKPNRDTITLVKEPWTVPRRIDQVVPFRAGTTLQWQLQ